MPIITLTSDYGILDHYMASVKGTLLSESPDFTLVDIAHTIEPGNFFEAAFILRNCYASFPKGTVHLVAFQEIAENGKLLAAEMDGHFFLVADNGLLPMINPDLKIKKTIEIDLRAEKTMFPAKDILTRAANHLARGGSIDLLGRQVKEISQKTSVRPIISNDRTSIKGSVVYIDNFGNLISNISLKTFKEVGQERSFEIRLPRNQRISKLSESYHSVSVGTMLAFFNSQNLLEIAVRDARGKHFNGANSLLGVAVQNSITVQFK